ncbi:MAG: alpha-glucosidase [Chloroflexi bacterium]|nr:alpha-glucosidase [Chloroflexota bacterium]
MEPYLWWRDGIIYQIYPRSFADSNSDGLGDLPGIVSKLDYLAGLGIDAIWLSPFYPTPDKDSGYVGTLADFDRLVAEAHRRGIRIVLDMVMNHTSDQHPWFIESRSSRQNPKRDWYIWKPPTPLPPPSLRDTSPISEIGNGGGREGVPNNWQASFGGKAWEYDPATGEYYLHLFTREQPDVNWRNPEVRRAQLDAFRFWLKRGVDGFRLDVFNAYFKHADFPNNPPKLGLRAFDRQKHIFDIDQPEMMPLLNELRLLLDSYPERYAVGETYFATPEKTVSYCGPDKLHAAFSFDFTSANLIYPWSPRYILARIAERERIFNAASVWPTTVMSNHDLPRAVSRYIPGEDDRMAKIIMTLLLTLRGTPFLYQGEEIGMRDIPLKRSELLDPPGKKYWPIYKGRDGCRSPMQWDDSPNAGFSTARTWLKVHPDFCHRNVAAQQADPDSLLHFTKALIALRKSHPALRRGEYVPVAATRHVLAFLRKSGAETILVALNFSKNEKMFSLPAEIHLAGRLLSSEKNSASNSPQEILLAPYEASLWKIR